MEEEKAAEYYDDLVRKGGNAAKFKQGLGFGTHTTAVPSSGAYNSLGNFVKAASPGRAAAISNEIRVESIRDKLKKRADDSSREVGSKQRSLDVADTKPAHKSELRDSDLEEKTNEKPRCLRRSPSGNSDISLMKKSSGRQRNDRSRSRSRNRRKATRSPKSSSEESEGSARKKSSDRSKRGRSRTRSKSKERRRRSRSLSRGYRRRYSRSPSHGNGKGKGRSDIDSRRRYSERRPRRSSSDDSIGRSSDRGRKRSRRDRSPSPSSYRHSVRISYSRSRRSRSRSYERRRRDRSRSRSRGRESDYRRRDRAYSPYRSRRRERIRSPPVRRSYSSHRENGASGRSDRRRDERRDERRSSSRHRDEKADKSAEHRSRKSKESQPPERDYSKIIPNFDSMTPAEKVKAKTKLQLSETVEKDHAMGMTGEWERFDFNNSAPLDGDAKMDDFGDGTGAADDTEFMKNTGSTYLSSSNQVSRENQVAATHESAIFGPPEGVRLRTSQPEVLAGTPEEKDHPNGVATIERMIEDDDSARPPLDSVVSEQVINMQQATSWQERARKSREARAAALAS